MTFTNDLLHGMSMKCERLESEVEALQNRIEELLYTKKLLMETIIERDMEISVLKSVLKKDFVK